jgi:hypothetical protein
MRLIHGNLPNRQGHLQNEPLLPALIRDGENVRYHYCVFVFCQPRSLQENRVFQLPAYHAVPLAVHDMGQRPFCFNVPYLYRAFLRNARERDPHSPAEEDILKVLHGRGKTEEHQLLFEGVQVVLCLSGRMLREHQLLLVEVLGHDSLYLLRGHPAEYEDCRHNDDRNDADRNLKGLYVERAVFFNEIKDETLDKEKMLFFIFQCSASLRFAVFYLQRLQYGCASVLKRQVALCVEVIVI